MMSAGDSSLLLTAWLMGLLGGTHCVGMCGGISAALSFSLPEHARGGSRLFGYQLAYNSGRLLSYTALGIMAGILAQGLLAGWVQSPWPRVVAALFMVALGLYLAGWWSGLQKIEGLGSGLWKRLAPLRRKMLPIDHPLKAVAAGGLWGFLPCGLVYSALALALARADSTMSGAIMLAFGLGTLPTLLVTGTLAGRLRQLLQKPRTRQLAGLLVIFFGVWTATASLMHTSHGHAHTEHSMPEHGENHHHH